MSKMKQINCAKRTYLHCQNKCMVQLKPGRKFQIFIEKKMFENGHCTQLKL